MIRPVMPVEMPPKPGLQPAAVLADMELKIEQMIASRDLYAAAHGLVVGATRAEKVALLDAAVQILREAAPTKLKPVLISSRIQEAGIQTKGVKRDSTAVSTALQRGKAERPDYGLVCEGEGRNTLWGLSNGDRVDG